MPEYWIAHRPYRTKGVARDTVKAVLQGNAVGTELSGEDFALVRDLLDMHPEAADKIGPGVAIIRIAPPLPGTKYNRFELVWTDGTPMDFSYPACFDHPNIRTQVHNAMRFEVRDKRTAYFEARFTEGTFTSDQSGVPLHRNDTAVSHFRGPPFRQIADAFADTEGGWEAIELTSSTDPGPGRFVDHDQAERWRAHWEEHAVLGLLTSAEERARPQS